MQTNEEVKAGRKQKAREYSIDIFVAWCKSCGICVAFCPGKCLDQQRGRLPLCSQDLTFARVAVGVRSIVRISP